MNEPNAIDEAARLVYDLDLRWRGSDHFSWPEAPEWIKRRCYSRAVMAYHPDGRPVPTICGTKPDG